MGWFCNKKSYYYIYNNFIYIIVKIWVKNKGGCFKLTTWLPDYPFCAIQNVIQSEAKNLVDIKWVSPRFFLPSVVWMTNSISVILSIAKDLYTSTLCFQILHCVQNDNEYFISHFMHSRFFGQIVSVSSYKLFIKLFTATEYQHLKPL